MQKYTAESILLFYIVALSLIVGCGTQSNRDTLSQENNASDIPHIIISQDTFDSDNFSLLTAAKKMDKRGIIKLLAVDITGNDTGNNSSRLFSMLLWGMDVPIFVNHATYSRATPSSQIYDLNAYPNDGIPDSQRPDSTEGLAQLLATLPEGKKALYVVGGHLTNIADLVEAYPEVVKEKISQVVISTGWSDRTSGKPEMNLSRGTYKPTPVSRATQRFFAHVPKSVKVVIASDPDAPYPKVPTKWISNEALYYLVTNGHYYKHDGYFYMGDFEALLYGAVGTAWYNVLWAREVKTCFRINDYGAATLTDGECNHFYLDDVRSDIVKQIFKEMI